MNNTYWGLVLVFVLVSAGVYWSAAGQGRIISITAAETSTLKDLDKL